MIVIALDTNFVTPRIIHGGKRSIQDINLLDRLLFLKSKEKIKISFPKTTQAEVYAILRAGRVKFKSVSTEKKEYRKLPHATIMKFVHRYKNLFDVEFIESLSEVPRLDNREIYKQALFNEIRYHLNMRIEQQEEYLVNKMIDISSCKDPYDYFIMVSSIQDNANYLVTNNTKDFPNPLGDCEIITEKEIYDILPMYP